MAIFRLIREWDRELDALSEEMTEITHAGRVFRVFNDSHRAMSDVYTDATFAECIRDDGTLERVLVNANFECDHSRGHAIIDASEELIAKHRSLVTDLERRAAIATASEAERRNRLVIGGTVSLRVKHGKISAGHTGVIAFIKGGAALLKSADCWRDRKASGVWIPLSKLG